MSRPKLTDFSTINEHDQKIEVLQHDMDDMKTWRGHMDTRMNEISLTLGKAVEDGEARDSALDKMSQTFTTMQTHVETLRTEAYNRRKEMMMYIAGGVLLMTVIHLVFKRW
jgi:hypothetical protein